MVVSLGRYKKSVSQRKVISVAIIAKLFEEAHREEGESKNTKLTCSFILAIGTQFYFEESCLDGKCKSAQ